MAEPSKELYRASRLYEQFSSISLERVADRYQIDSVRTYDTLDFWLDTGCKETFSKEENERAMMVRHWLTEIDRDYRSARRLLKRLGEVEGDYRSIKENLSALFGKRATESKKRMFRDYASEFTFDCIELCDFILHRVYHMWDLTGQLMWSFYGLGGKWKEAKFPEVRGLVIDQTLDDFFDFAGVVVSRRRKVYVKGIVHKMKELRNRVTHGSSGISATESLEIGEGTSIKIWDHNTGEYEELEVLSNDEWMEYARESYVHFVICYNMLLNNLDINLLRADISAKASTEYEDEVDDDINVRNYVRVEEDYVEDWEEDIVDESDLNIEDDEDDEGKCRDISWEEYLARLHRNGRVYEMDTDSIDFGES